MAIDDKTVQRKALDEEKVEEFAGRVLEDVGTALAAATAYVGHKTGLYRALAEMGALTAGELARATGTAERYVSEWLNAQAAGGYVEYDPGGRTYRLPPEHAAVLVDTHSPVYMAGSVDTMAAVWAAVDRVTDDFRAARGVGWHEHDPRLFTGTEELFRPSYETFLTSQWIPALDGVEGRLLRGAKVADVGCGHGVSTIMMAHAYPKSRFFGFDSHPGSIETARERAAEAGQEASIRFEVSDASSFPGEDYDLVCFFDCLHDMGDPVSALARAREVMGEDGVVMLIEPYAADRVEDNFTPVGRLYYSGSALVCTPNAVAQGARPALGAQAGEARLREVAERAGFTRVRRAAETPFNLLLELRP